MYEAAFREILITRFSEARAKNPSFSKRAFAKRLAISHGALSEIMTGKRKISPRLAARLCERLMLAPQEKRRALTPVPLISSLPASLISEDQFHAIADWYHFALLNLISIRSEKTDDVSLAARLALPKSVIARALARLSRMKLIAQKNGRWVRTSQPLQTSDEVRSAAIQASHAQFIEIARSALQDVPVEERDFTTMTMAVSPKNLSEAKARIRTFLDELSSILEGGSASEVYVFGTQLFPVTSKPPKGNK